GPVRFPHRLAATCQPTANGSRSGGVALLHQSRSALRRSELGHGRGQASGARMHGLAPWKTAGSRSPVLCIPDQGCSIAHHETQGTEVLPELSALADEV